MWKRLFDLLQEALFLQRDVKQNKEDTTKLRADLAEVQQAVRALANEVQRINEREQSEREKFILKIENVLLRFERQLPPGKESKKLK
jgi:predicted  nucleic acid-binding Zn-ribbon protein